VNPTEALGQTIEFLPKRPAPQIVRKQPVKVLPHMEDVQNLMTSMLLNQTPQGFQMRHQRVQGKRFKNGLKVTPSRVYRGPSFQGDVMAITNEGTTPITLHESWFSEQGVKAISLSSNTLAPKQKVLAYRVKSHG